MNKLIVTNFAYGTGPYLRMTDLAIAFNDQLEAAGHERLPVIIPWVYGDKQRRIMLEEFAAHDRERPRELLLDAELGAILRSVFYADSTYADALRAWTANADVVSGKAHAHLSSTFSVETLSGEKLEVNGKHIVVELNRSPRIRFGVAPSYFTSFGYIESILTQALEAPEGSVAVDRDLLQKGAAVARRIEGEQKMRCIAYPATFSYAADYAPRYPGEILVPPIGPVPKVSTEPMDKGIFVTITGIPGLERLYEEARQLGITLYSNDTEAVPGSVRALPHVISNENIQLQFARSGWNSVWLSMVLGRPLVVPDFDPTDDPEIYFNNRAVEEMGVGIIYRGQSLKELLAESGKVQEAQARMSADVKERWDTFDGIRHCAELFASDFTRGGNE